MYHSYQFERNARRNRQRALFLTIVFHLLLLAGIFYAGQDDLAALIPDPVKELLGMQKDQPAEELVIEAVRP